MIAGVRRESAAEFGEVVDRRERLRSVPRVGPQADVHRHRGSRGQLVHERRRLGRIHVAAGPVDAHEGEIESADAGGEQRPVVVGVTGVVDAHPAGLDHIPDRVLGQVARHRVSGRHGRDGHLSEVFRVPGRDRPELVGGTAGTGDPIDAGGRRDDDGAGGQCGEHGRQVEVVLVPVRHEHDVSRQLGSCDRRVGTTLEAVHLGAAIAEVGVDDDRDRGCAEAEARLEKPLDLDRRIAHRAPPAARTGAGAPRWRSRLRSRRSVTGCPTVASTA